MATQLQDIIAKRAELQKTNPNATNVDARKALESTPTPTPSPVPTPIATPVNVMDQMAGKTVAERQAIRSGTPAPTLTPVETTPTPTQVTPATPTVAEVKPEPVKTPTVKPIEAPIDYNKSQGREQEIQANIKQITTDNPALLKDRNAYNQAFGYDTADQGKKAMLDASFTGANTPVLMNQKDIVSALVSGVSIPEQNTQAYRNATVVANQFKKFNGMTDVQLLDNLKQGQIGTELDSLLSQNTNYAKAKAELAKAQKTASINRATQIASNVISGKETPIVDDLANIEAKYNPPIGANAQAYQDYVVKNPDVVSAGSQVKQLSTQISDLTKTYNDALKSIKAQYGDMPASALLTLMGSRTSETKELLDSYINAKELAKGDFDLAMKMAEGSYGAFTRDRAEQQQIASEQRQVQAQKDMMQYKSDFERQQAQEALNDPYTAIPQLIAQYQKMGIPITRSTQQIIQDFESSGQDLGTYLTGLQKLIQEKPEYQQMLAKQKGEGISYETIGDSVYRKNADGTLTKTNISPTKSPTPVWKEWEDSSGKHAGWVTPGQNPGLSIAKNEATAKYGTTPAVRNFNPGNIMDTGFGGKKVEGERFTVFDTPQEGFNALVAKIKNVQAGNSKVYSPEMTLLQYISKYAPSSDNNNPQGYASAIAKNLGITTGTKIKDIDPIKLAEEHARHEDGNSYRMLKDLGIIGGGQVTSTGTQGTFNSTDARVFNSLTPSEKAKKQNDPKYQSFVELQNQVYNNPDASIEDILKYSAGGDNVGETSVQQLTKFNQALSQIKGLNDSITDQTTGPILGALRSYNPYDSSAQALKAELNSLIPNIARGVYGEVGVLTDADIENYRKTLPNIRSTEDTNKLVLAMTLQTMLNGYKGQLQTLAGSNRDVSKLAGKYKEYEKTIDSLLSGIQKKQSNTAPVDVAGQLKASNGKTYTF